MPPQWLHLLSADARSQWWSETTLSWRLRQRKRHEVPPGTHLDCCSSDCSHCHELWAHSASREVAERGGLLDETQQSSSSSSTSSAPQRANTPAKRAAERSLKCNSENECTSSSTSPSDSDTDNDTGARRELEAMEHIVRKAAEFIHKLPRRHRLRRELIRALTEKAPNLSAVALVLGISRCVIYTARKDNDSATADIGASSGHSSSRTPKSVEVEAIDVWYSHSRQSNSTDRYGERNNIFYLHYTKTQLWKLYVIAHTMRIRKITQVELELNVADNGFSSSCRTTLRQECLRRTRRHCQATIEQESAVRRVHRGRGSHRWCCRRVQKHHGALL